MNENTKTYTHIALVLDASGSMERLRTSTVSTMRDFFAAIKSPEDKTVVDLWQFDDRVQHLLDGIDLTQGTEEAIEGYTTGGSTALYDAICIGIDELGKKFAAMPEEERPDAVVFAILTDGFENSSRHFSVQDVRARIEHQTNTYKWTFRFLAANQDAVLTGREMGLEANACDTIEASAAGMHVAGQKMRCMFEVAHDVACAAREKKLKQRKGKR